MTVVSRIFVALIMFLMVAGFIDEPIANLNSLPQLFKSKTGQSEWVHKKSIKLDFDAFHTQGMVKIGQTFFVSAVEIIEPTEILGASDNLYDRSITRTVGKGRGWLFKINSEGELLQKLELTDGDIYHPGGIDFDGENLWVPVAEYRPNSASNIYRVNPETMQATLWFKSNDHIGNVVYNSLDNTFHGSSWGARRIYTWVTEQKESGFNDIIERFWAANPSHYIDYQDCQYQSEKMMLCGGVKKYDSPEGDVALGGIDLIDISSGTPRLLHSLPITEYWRGDKVITNNPLWAEVDNGIMRFYFLPDKNGDAELLVYDLIN